MRGLLLKDWFIIWKQCKYMLFIPILFFVVSLFPGNAFFSLFPALFLSMFPITVMGLDERTHWDHYALTMPYSRRDIVLSKYLLSLISLGIGAIFYLAITVLGAQGSPNWQSLSYTVCTILGIGLLYSAVIYPILFHFGVEKGRMWFYLSVIVISAGIGALASLSEDWSSQILQLVAAHCYLIPIAGLALLGVSAAASVKIYSAKEF